MMIQHGYTIILRPENGTSYVAFVPALPGCYSTGKTPNEALQLAEDAIRNYLQGLSPDRYPADIDTAKLMENLKSVA